MDLVEISKAKPGELPVSRATAYKWRTEQRYPALLVKVGGKLFFDRQEWLKMASECRDRQVRQAERLRALAEGGLS